MNTGLKTSQILAKEKEIWQKAHKTVVVEAFHGLPGPKFDQEVLLWFGFDQVPK